MDRSSLRKRNIGSKPAAEAVARSGSVAANKDNLIQAKAQQNLISQSPPSQLLAINRSAMGDKNSSTRLIQSKVNPPKRAPSESATNASNESVGSLKDIAQRKKQSGFPVVQKEVDPYKVDKAEVMKGDSDTTFDKVGAGLETTADVAEMGITAHDMPGDIDKAVTETKDTLTPDNLDWDPKTNKKRTPKQQKEWMKKNGYSEDDVEKMKAKAATEAAIKGGIATTLSFMKLPSLWTKFKKAENNYEKFGIALEGAETVTGGVTAGAQIADAASGGKDEGAQNTAAISEYTGGIIGLVKNAWNAAMDVKKAYDEYAFIRDNAEGNQDARDVAYAVLKNALATTQGVLSNINSYQKGFGDVLNQGIVKSIPAISIASTAISVIEKLFFLGNSMFEKSIGKTGQESQTENVISKLALNPEQEKKARGHLQSEEFRKKIVAAAGYRQQQRDNPEIFEKYKQSRKEFGNPMYYKIRTDLKRNFPENFKRIHNIYEETQRHPEDLNEDAKELSKLGITQEIFNEIIEDQTLINQLQEIKGKRVKNASLGIFTDLLNMGSDIATLTGGGAVAGAALKAGSAAIGIARKGGNMVKSAARESGAKEFASGAEEYKLFGRSSLTDKTDILKSSAAKEERYFSSATMILKSIQDHDTKADKMERTPTDSELKANHSSYEWTEAKIQSAGASVAMIKAMLNSGKKTGNDMVKYFMDKLKVR